MKKFIIFFSLLITLSITAALPSFSEEEILIIFDASMSMADSVNDKPKYKIAAKAIDDYLKNLPPQKKVGYRQIGLQINYTLLDFLQNPDSICTASQLINPISANNAFNIRRSLDVITPLGSTPLTYSLRTSVENDFSQSANPKHIILITDGAESCGENPCLYAKELSEKRKDVKIDILAINVQTGDIEQLRCISDYTGGNVFEVKDDSDFHEAFNNIKFNKKPNLYRTNTQPDRYTNYTNNSIIYKNFLIEVAD